MTVHKIGDELFLATFSPSASVYVECPDCGGTGRMRVIFHDETVVSIDCGNCSRGYNPPTGRILVYKNKPDAKKFIISGVEVNTGEPPRYKHNMGGCYQMATGDKLFKTKEKALEKAKELHADYVKKEEARIFKKEKDTRTWAWNASYHRGLIKRAKRDIEYHTKKLDAANLKRKGAK